MMTLCEGGCGEEVELETTESCQYCDLDPLCPDCTIPEEHRCPGKPGRPGDLTLEVGQRVQDKFQQEKQDIGRIMEVTEKGISIFWSRPMCKKEVYPMKVAESLLENSDVVWDGSQIRSIRK